jgi:hypothetical protein
VMSAVPLPPTTHSVTDGARDALENIFRSDVGLPPAPRIPLRPLQRTSYHKVAQRAVTAEAIKLNPAPAREQSSAVLEKRQRIANSQHERRRLLLAQSACVGQAWRCRVRIEVLAAGRPPRKAPGVGAHVTQACWLLQDGRYGVRAAESHRVGADGNACGG